MPTADDGKPTAQLQALHRVALRSRIRGLTGGRLEVPEADLDPRTPAVVVDGRAFYQTDDLRGLGPALRWAMANDATTLSLLVESDADVAGGLVRRAGLLATGDPGGTTGGHTAAGGPVGSVEVIEVWSADGPELAVAEPVQLAPPPELADEHLRFASLIAEAGARPVDDHGLLVAEVAGLEVARVVEDAEHDGPRLSVGVGQADRELQGLVHGDLDVDARLRLAIAEVARHRRPGSAAHPISRLSRQRWLRSVVLDNPELLGLDTLDPVAPLRPRATLLSQEPAAASGAGVVVVCSVGVDLDLIPEAADYRARENPDAELIVVVPERDRELAAGPLAEAVPRLRLMSIASPWGDPEPAG